jgi:glutathione S-transferase
VIRRVGGTRRACGFAQEADEHGRQVTSLAIWRRDGRLLTCLDVLEIFDSGNAAHKIKTEVRKLVGRWFGDVERRLEDREWIACADFTVADIMMAGVLRTIRKTDLLDPFPRIKAYYQRCQARPAWQRALGLYAERIGVSVDDIR